MISIYSFSEYREFFRTWVAAQAQGRGLKTKIAQAIGCQNSHLTRIFRDEVHFTPDQAFEAANFMKLSESESTYFMKMVEIERAANSNYRNKLRSELKKLKADQEDLAKRFDSASLDNLEKEMTYYSSWHWSAIHILTDIPEYRTVSSIALRLNLSEVFVRHSLQVLQNFGLVQNEGQLWKIANRFIHLAKNSPMNSIQHGNWRSRAVLSSQNKQNGHLHFTMVQTVSLQDFEILKQLLLKAIDEYRKIADQSKEEELICFALDFFKA